MRHLYGIGIVWGLAAGWALGGVEADGYARWQAQAEKLRQDPALVRYYCFEEQKGFTVANRAGGGQGELNLVSNSPYGTSRETRWWTWNSPFFQTFPEWTEGRWPGKGALASGLAGTNAVRSRFSGTSDGIFSLAAWVRLHGVASRADLFNISDGYKSGWKVTYQKANWRPQGSVEFRFGTPGGPVVLNVAPFEPQVWHQLVCQWDGQAIRVYIDGALAGEKPCAGPYVNIERNELWSRDFFEFDVGGFHFGGRPGTERFDVDEVAIFSRVLPEAEIKAQYDAGRPEASAEAQKAAFAPALARRQALAGIKLEIPNDTLGIFRRGAKIPATIALPAAGGWQGAYQAHFLLRDLRNETIFAQTLPLAATAGQDTQARHEFALDRCGVYFLDMWVTDPAGQVLKRLREEYGLAITVPLPPPAEIPLTSPLMAHHISGGFYENVYLGFGVDRWIKSNATYRKPGEWNGEPFAKEMEFERQAGLKIMFCLHLYAPDWAEKLPGKKWQMKDMTPWADYVRQMYRHYKDIVAFWEIENEPNAGDLVTPEEYAEFLKVAYQTLKEEDPKAVVVGLCGCPGFLNWNEKVYAAGGAKNFDVMSLHNYRTYPIRSLREDRLIERAIDQLVKARGERVPVWNSESGFHAAARVDGRPVTEDMLVRQYGARATQRPGQPVYVGADMPVLTEHATAIWQLQSILLDLGAGCEKYFMLAGPSHYSPTFNSCNMQPTVAAPAIAALQSVLIPSRSWAMLPLTSSADAGVLITQADGRRVAALFSDEQPTLSFRVNRAGTLKGMDWLGNPLTWDVGANKVLTMKLAPEPLYLLDVPEGFAQLEFLKVTKAPATMPESGFMEGELTVSNPLDRPLAATLKPEAPKGATLEVATPVPVLQPGESRVLPFRLDGRELGRRRYEIGCQLLAGNTQLGKANYSFLSEGAIRKVAELAAPGPLGDGRWWQALKPEVCADVANVVHGQPILGLPSAPQWKNPQDLSFALRLAWISDDAVRLRIDVTDDALVPAAADKRGLCFKYDCLELFFDGRSLANRKDVYSKGAEQVLVIPQIGTTPAPCDFWFGGSKDKEPTVRAEFVGARSEQGYWIEGTIRPQPGASFRVRAGSQFACDVLVDDCDTEAAPRKAAMALHGVFNNASDPSKWGRYRLDPREDKQ